MEMSTEATKLAPAPNSALKRSSLTYKGQECMVKTVLHIKQCSDIFPENSSLSIINFKALSKPVINSWPFASSILPVQSATKPVSISCGISIMMWWFALNLKLSARIYWQSCTGCGWHDVARGGLVEINGCTHLVTESRKELKKKNLLLL